MKDIFMKERDNNLKEKTGKLVSQKNVRHHVHIFEGAS